jgi:rhodanese-related sulfurtransferase
MSKPIAQLSPVALASMLAPEAAQTPFLLDVREPEEFAICRIAGTTLIPMREVPQRLSELPSDVPIICICHHGGRSMQVAMFLASRGFDNVNNLAGGIDRWARDVDPAMPTY